MHRIFGLSLRVLRRFRLRLQTDRGLLDGPPLVDVGRDAEDASLTFRFRKFACPEGGCRVFRMILVDDEGNAVASDRSLVTLCDADSLLPTFTVSP